MAQPLRTGKRLEDDVNSRTVAVAVLIVLAALGLETAAATPMTLEATRNSMGDPTSTSGFTIQFEDTGDGLLQLTEITSFSGMTYFYYGNLFFDQVLSVPTVANVSSGNEGGFWVWGNSQGDSGGSEAYLFNYRRSSSVPEPGALALLGLGLAGLCLRSRRKA